MTDRDGIYLNKIWVCDASEIATTYQGNDLTKPDRLTTSYTNTFTIPDSVKFRIMSDFAEQLDSKSNYPYRLIPAYVIDGGETRFTGVAKLTEFSSGWKAALYEEKRDLFARLTRSIRTADLSRFDHDWTLENINARAGATDGVCYPLIDYGLVSANSVPLDTVFPATYAHTIVRQLLKEEGYSFVGDLPADPLFKRLALPFVEQEGTNHDEKWVNDRKARVTQNNVEYHVQRSAFDSGRIMDRIQPFTIDDQPAETWSQGILKNYDTKTFTYVCDTAMRLRVDAFQQFKCKNTSGAVEFILQLLKNGNNIHQEYFHAVGPYNLLNQKKESLVLGETVPCQKGDRIQLRFITQRQTTLSAFEATIYNDPNSSWAAFTPDISLHTGDNWPVARNLPDITGVALLVDIAHLFGGTWYVNSRRRQVRFSSLSATIANSANAVDWSNRLDTDPDRPPSWVPVLSPYAQSNYLKWKETEDTKAIDGGLNYGDGVISVNADTLETSTDLFELSFAASTDSISEIAGYGKPLKIETRTVSGSTSASSTISKKNTTARLILVEPSKSVEVASKRFASDGITIEDVKVKLKPCWFGPRPNIAVSSDTAFCLCFSPIKTLRGEVALIPRNYAGLARVLRRMRVLGTSVRLYPEDIEALDFDKPIRLKRVDLDGLILSDGLYYLNSVNNYRSNDRCTVTLIAF